MALLLILFVINGPEETNLTGVKSEDYNRSISWERVVNGEYQKSIKAWLNSHFYGYSDVIRIHNQIEYSVVGDATGEFVQGKSGYLFSGLQSNLYVMGEKGNPNSVTEYDAYAQSVASLQEELNSKNKDFLYILTPSKTEIMEEYLPWNYKLLANMFADSPNTAHAMLIDAFDKDGVNYYDATQDIKDLNDLGNVVVYHKGAHHWTLSAAVYEIDKIFTEKNKNFSHVELPKIYVDSYREGVYSQDNDIIDAQNLFFSKKDNSFIIPDIKYEQSDSSVFLFGTSYGREIMDALYTDIGNRAFDVFSFAQYFTEITDCDDNGVCKTAFSIDDNPSELGIMERINNSDLIIVEQNSTFGIRETHKKFVDFVVEGLR